MTSVAVVFGGDTEEHEVSVASGEDVIGSLRSRGRVEVVTAFVDRAGRWHLGEDGRAEASDALCVQEALDRLPDDTVVFPALHGGWGEGGGLQRAVELRGLGLVGSGSEAAAAGLSKHRAQQIWNDAGLPVIATVALTRAAFADDPHTVASQVRVTLPGDVVVKPDSGGSSVGVHVVPAGQSVRIALEDVFARDEVALVQPRLHGDEVAVGVWEDADGTVRTTGASLLHLPADADGDVFSYAHKYEGAGGTLEIPAPLDPAVLTSLQEIARRAFAVLGCRDLARVDFFLTDTGRIVLGEINTMPGMRRRSHFPRLVAAAGVGYDDLVERMVIAAQRRAGQASASGANESETEFMQ